jgi:hypothetical protein
MDLKKLVLETIWYLFLKICFVKTFFQVVMFYFWHNLEHQSPQPFNKKKHQKDQNRKFPPADLPMALFLRIFLEKFFQNIGHFWSNFSTRFWMEEEKIEKKRTLFKSKKIIFEINFLQKKYVQKKLAWFCSYFVLLFVTSSNAYISILQISWEEILIIWFEG